MKYLGKRLLLSGVILAMIGGSVAGVPDSVGAKTKAKTELTKKTPAGKKAPKKVDYKKVQKQYNQDLDDIRITVKLITEYNKQVNLEDSGESYETDRMKKLKTDIKKGIENWDKSINLLNKKVKATSSKVSKVNTLSEKSALDKEILNVENDFQNVLAKHKEVSDNYRDYFYEEMDVSTVSEVTFKKLYPESIGLNGTPDEFEDVLTRYVDVQLLKKGREYANKKLTEGYSQDRVAEWYLTEFDDLISLRSETSYMSLLKLKDGDLEKFTDPLYKRDFEVLKNNMDAYNSYVDGLKKRIDDLIQKDLKKVAI